MKICYCQRLILSIARPRQNWPTKQRFHMNINVFSKILLQNDLLSNTVEEVELDKELIMALLWEDQQHKRTKEVTFIGHLEFLKKCTLVYLRIPLTKDITVKSNTGSPNSLHLFAWINLQFPLWTPSLIIVQLCCSFLHSKF